jgi:hypothetical protein
MKDELPPELRDEYEALSGFAVAAREEEILKLRVRLRDLRSEMLKRSLDWRGVGKQYAENCELCKGTGKYHFCIRKYCSSTHEVDLEDCLHPTPHELLLLQGIHEDHFKILVELRDLVRTGLTPSVIIAMSKPGKEKSEKDVN